MHERTKKSVHVPGFSLRFLLLLVTAMAVWFGLRADTRLKEHKIAELKPILGEVTVKDFDAFGIRSLRDARTMAFGDESRVIRRCEVYLPRGGSYQLCFAGSGIGPTGFPNPQERRSIDSGYRTIEMTSNLENGLWTFRVKIDDQVVVTREYDGSIPSRVFRYGSDTYLETQQLPTDQPLEVMRVVLGPITPSTPSGKALGPTDGILIWIQK